MVDVGCIMGIRLMLNVKAIDKLIAPALILNGIASTFVPDILF